MIWIIIGIAVYLLSAFGVWKYFHLAHSKGGIWERIDTNLIYIIINILPFINTLMAIMLWVIDYPVKGKKLFNYNKFFNIK